MGPLSPELLPCVVSTLHRFAFSIAYVATWEEPLVGRRKNKQAMTAELRASPHPLMSYNLAGTMGETRVTAGDAAPAEYARELSEAGFPSVPLKA